MVSHPGVGDARAGVLESGQQPDGKVVRQMQELIIVVVKTHIAERLLGISEKDVSGYQASEDPEVEGSNKEESLLFIHCSVTAQPLLS